jgi:hypothetical protein
MPRGLLTEGQNGLFCVAERHRRAGFAWPVSPRVGNVKNNDASLIEPVGTG